MNRDPTQWSGVDPASAQALSPVNSKPPVLAVRSKGTSGNERPTRKTPWRSRRTVKRLAALIRFLEGIDAETLFTGLGRTGTVMKTLTQTTEQFGTTLRAFG
jgi:hypothetical protein